MTLQQLRYVTAVADCGSMNEAAKTLFVSQPGLSGAIKELEEETGIEIFKRTNKGVLPTPEGEEFLGYARQLLDRKSTRLNSSHNLRSRMPSSA